MVREECHGVKKIYDLQCPENQVRILDADGKDIVVFEDSELPQKTKHIFEAIKNAGRGTFQIQEARDLMERLLCEKVKAS